MSLKNGGDFTQTNTSSDIVNMNVDTFSPFEGVTSSFAGSYLSASNYKSLTGLFDISELFGGSSSLSPTLFHLSDEVISTTTIFGNGVSLRTITPDFSSQGTVLVGTSSVDVYVQGNSSGYISGLSLNEERSYIGYLTDTTNSQATFTTQSSVISYIDIGNTGVHGDITLSDTDIIILKGDINSNGSQITFATHSIDMINQSDSDGDNGINISNNGISISMATTSNVISFGSTNYLTPFLSIEGTGKMNATMSYISATMGYVDNAEAISNGLTKGDFYHTGGILKIVI